MHSDLSSKTDLIWRVIAILSLSIRRFSLVVDGVKAHDFRHWLVKLAAAMLSFVFPHRYMPK
ncbi:hypothetical protein SAMN05444422_11191 [Halobiforma haloterrestris]|uniref:Uncharacterized protein n=1 Tax=Natronobacterium haloterrestre TaxID=148448 RepID=A0A1I1KPU6_NATHA|nr:hypothetical protein SAMN05444422_11191 [Halobiforma haloterrestris]